MGQRQPQGPPARPAGASPLHVPSHGGGRPTGGAAAEVCGCFPELHPPSSARKAPGSWAARCPGGRANEVSLGSPGVGQMVIKCDEGFDG